MTEILRYILQKEILFIAEESTMYLYLREKNNHVCIFNGLRKYAGGLFAGYSMILEDAFGHAYQIGWFGTGNMSRIKTEAEEVFRGFTVKFDIEQWLKENK